MIECDAALAYETDWANRTLTYEGGALALPARLEGVVVLEGDFRHPRATPCFPFAGLQPQATREGEARLAVPPFEASVPFRIGAGHVEAEGRQLAPGGAVTRAVDQGADGVHYTGNLTLEFIGRWPRDHLRPR
jgi:hypothetical protein